MADLADRLKISPEAARALAKRLRLPRVRSNDGKALVSVDLAENQHKPVPGRRAFLLPSGAPPRAPCIRQTALPLTAGDRHGFPVRFEQARHRGDWCMSKSMGLFSSFLGTPTPRMADIADDCGGDLLHVASAEEDGHASCGLNVSRAPLSGQPISPCLGTGYVTAILF